MNPSSGAESGTREEETVQLSINSINNGEIAVMVLVGGLETTCFGLGSNESTASFKR